MKFTMISKISNTCQMLIIPSLSMQYTGISLERLCKTTSESNRIRIAHFRIYVQALPMHQQLWLLTSQDIFYITSPMKDVVDITLRPLYLWERTPVPLEQEAGWTPESVWTFWRRESPSPLLGFEPHIPP
jgi:hypothetical protein